MGAFPHNIVRPYLVGRFRGFLGSLRSCTFSNSSGPAGFSQVLFSGSPSQLKQGGGGSIGILVLSIFCGSRIPAGLCKGPQLDRSKIGPFPYYWPVSWSGLFPLRLPLISAAVWGPLRVWSSGFWQVPSPSLWWALSIGGFSLSQLNFLIIIIMIFFGIARFFLVFYNFFCNRFSLNKINRLHLNRTGFPRGSGIMQREPPDPEIRGKLKPI